MKRLIIPFVILAAAACTRELPEVLPSAIIDNEITITASCGDPETRTERATGGAVNWLPGDEISVFYGSGADGGSKFISQNTAPTPTANFTGTIGVITGGNDVSIENTYFWAVYPYNPTASCNGSSITTTLPSSQVATADTFADDLFPSVGRSQGLVMGFYNICGGLKFTISEEGIKSVILRGNNDELLAGDITVALDDDGLPVVKQFRNGSKTITVSAPNGETFQVGHSYYIVFVPKVFENGFTLTFKKDNTWAEYDRTKKTTIRRSSFGSLSAPDSGLQWNQLQYVPIPDENFRAYLIQKFDTNEDGQLDELEASVVRRIDDLYTDNISSLAGIEYFPNIEWLKCAGSRPNGITNYIEERGIDVVYYFGGTGQLTTLDVSHNPKLSYLNCAYNQIDSLNLCGNSMLDKLYCGYNQLRILDLSNNTALSYLNCNGNRPLVSVDLSNNLALEELYIQYNNLETLELSDLPKLERVSLLQGSLVSLNVRDCHSLQYLKFSENMVESASFAGVESLATLMGWHNRLTTIDLSGCPALSSFDCSFNRMETIEFGDIQSLTSLAFIKNNLSTLDVSSLVNLKALNCLDNPYLTIIWLNLGQSIPSLEYNPDITAIKYKGVDYDSELPSEISSADSFVNWLLKANENTTGEYSITVPEIDMAGKSFYSSSGFAGILEGNGCVIKNLVCGKPLFDNLKGTVKNLVFDSSCEFIPDAPVFGVVAGHNNGTIINVTNKANISYVVDNINKTTLLAAIAGLSRGRIVDCINEGDVLLTVTGAAKGLGVAGIVAYQSSALENCINRGNVSFLTARISEKMQVVDAENALPSVGGVCAIGAPGFSMEDCSNYGKVSFCVSAANSGLISNLNRHQIGGVVASPCGDVRDCNNYGEVNVSIKHSTPGTGLSYEFIACVGGIGGGDYLFTSTSGSISNTSYYNCTNEGVIIVDSDAVKSNTAVGGIVGWPGQEKRDSPTVVSSCVNRGTIIGRGIMKCRLGGIEGGTGNMENCINEGKVTLESGNVASAIGSLCGFHSCGHYIRGCTAGGEVVCEMPGVNYGVAGLIGNVGNQAMEIVENCLVNCKITVPEYDPQTMGLVAGRFNGSSASVIIGTQASPVRVSGSINGTPASDSNIYGTANDLNHTIYYVIN